MISAPFVFVPKLGFDAMFSFSAVARIVEINIPYLYCKKGNCIGYIDECLFVIMSLVQITYVGCLVHGEDKQTRPLL